MDAHEFEIIHIDADKRPNELSSAQRCIALGYFDGVHSGHADIIRKAVSYAHEHDMKACVQTFSGFTLKSSDCLMTLDEKAIVMRELGVDELIVIEFSKSIRNMSPINFFNEYIKELFCAKCIFVGNDYSFGALASGKLDLLTKLCEADDIRLNIVPDLMFKDANSVYKRISSTVIRSAIKIGDVKTYMELCDGRPFSYSGKVIHGKELGRTLGFPTVNIIPDKVKIIVPYGVYASKTRIDGVIYESVTNVGVRPSVENTNEVNVETYIFDYDDDCYGKYIDVYLLYFCRKERRFASTDELKDAIEQDKITALNYLKERNSDL